MLRELSNFASQAAEFTEELLSEGRREGCGWGLVAARTRPLLTRILHLDEFHSSSLAW